ncbi:MAG: GNAT family protein [Dysgonomonas sp.]|nr:GNAT family protein [Dysgonomonas sp.]
MQFPVLHTERLDLVEIGVQHLEDLFVLYGDIEVVRFYNLLPYTNVDDGRKYIEWYQERIGNGLAIRWGIALKGESGIIGTIGFNNYTRLHRANIGYDLQKKYWNKGYITEALEAVLDFGFETLEINRIEAEVMQSNLASEKVLHKLGFIKEGILREWMFWNNNYYDMSMFSLLKKDWNRGRLL